MSTIAILRNSLKLNAKEIYKLESSVTYFRFEARTWKNYEEKAFYESAQKDLRKYKAKLTRAVAMQKRIKVEIATYFRNERIARKYEQVFGRTPSKSQYTSHEREAMLDTLIEERKAVAETQQA